MPRSRRRWLIYVLFITGTVFFLSLLTPSTLSLPGDLAQVLAPKQIYEFSPRPSYAAPKELDAEWKRIQKNRQDLITSACQKYDRILSVPTNRLYKVHQKKQMVYCPMFKAGLSTWRTAFWYAAGLVNTTNITLSYRDDAPAGLQDVGWQEAAKMKNVYSFVFVRNPWDRLMSAYVDKVLETDYSWTNKVPCEDVRSMTSGAHDLTFTQFLKCISKTKPLEMDMHWRPQSYVCDFCRVKYTTIGHMETFAKDGKFILDHNGMNFALGRSNSFSSDTSRKRKKMSLHDWYKDIPSPVMERLETIYQYDLTMHGYPLHAPGRLNSSNT